MDVDNLGFNVANALGLPKNLKRFELIFEVNYPIVVRCEYMILDATNKEFEITRMFSEYELTKIKP